MDMKMNTERSDMQGDNTFSNGLSDVIHFRKKANLFPCEKDAILKNDFDTSYLRNETNSNQTKFEFVISAQNLVGKH